MKEVNERRKKVLNQPEYWVEKLNASLYEALVDYMETQKLTQKELAQYLNLSPGRVSQILNTGDINFSISKIIEIALKLGKVPNFRFDNMSEHLENLASSKASPKEYQTSATLTSRVNEKNETK